MFRGSHGVDQRSDLYSFGVMLYELLTGSYPLQGKTFVALANAHINDAPVPFDQTDKEGRVPQALRSCVMRALCKEPDDRMSTAQEFIDLLPEPAAPPPADELERTISATIVLTPREPGSKGLSTGGLAIAGAEVFPAHKTAPRESWNGPEPAGGGLDVDSLVERARELRDADQFEESLQVLYQVLLAKPGHPEAIELRNDVEESLREAAESARKRAEGIADRASDVEEDLAGGRFADAATKLEEARDDLGDATRFGELDERLVELRRELEAQEREQAIEEALAEVQEAIDKELPDDAEGGVRAAQEMLGQDPRFDEIGKAIAELRSELRSELEARAREAAVIEAVAAVNAAVEKEQPDAAESALQSARKKLGEDPRFDELAPAISALRETLAERERERLAAIKEATIVKVLEAVPRLLEAEGYVDARARLNSVVESAGSDERLAAALAQVDTREAEARAAALELAVAEVDEYLEAEDAEAAREAPRACPRGAR